MNTVKRYRCDGGPDVGSYMADDKDGDYVLATDYAAVVKERDDARLSEMLNVNERNLIIKACNNEIAALKQQLEQAQGEITRGIEEYVALANRFRDVLKCYEMPADRLPAIVQQALDRAEHAEAELAKAQDHIQNGMLRKMAEEADELDRYEKKSYAKVFPNRDGLLWRTRACLAEAAYEKAEARVRELEKVIEHWTNRSHLK